MGKDRSQIPHTKGPTDAVNNLNNRAEDEDRYQVRTKRKYKLLDQVREEVAKAERTWERETETNRMLRRKQVPILVL